MRPAVPAHGCGPDLEPGQLLQGHVKVSLDGACDGVSSYSLGLRFAERSWVKTPREGVTLPVNPMEESGQARRVPRKMYSNDSAYENNQVGWGNWVFPEVDETLWDKYHSDMENPALWVMREEERIAFETKYALSDEFPDGQIPSDLVKDFALLVPCTIYPPAFDKTFNIGLLQGINAAGAEHIYQYFVDVTFSNGTHREVEAGYTSFDIVTTPEPHPELENKTTGNIKLGIPGVDQESVNVTATEVVNESPHLVSRTLKPEDAMSRDKFTLEITFPVGRHLEQGSFNNITIVSHQIGPGTHRPVCIRSVSVQVKQRRLWAATHAADNETAEKLLLDGSMYDRELRPTTDDMVDPFRYYSYQRGHRLPRFSEDSAFESSSQAFSTEPVTAHFEVPENIYPPFRMYYQVSEVNLVVDMMVRNVSGFRLEVRQDVGLDSEEYDWTSTLLRDTAYDMDTKLVQAIIPVSIYRKPERRATLASQGIHYLSPAARAPVFVNPSSLPRLLQMTAEGRDALAPFAHPKFVTKAGGDVVKHRYPSSVTRLGQYYVGNTWLRKVIARHQERYAARRDPAFVVQV